MIHQLRKYPNFWNIASDPDKSLDQEKNKVNIPEKNQIIEPEKDKIEPLPKKRIDLSGLKKKSSSIFAQMSFSNMGRFVLNKKAGVVFGIGMGAISFMKYKSSKVNDTLPNSVSLTDPVDSTEPIGSLDLKKFFWDNKLWIATAAGIIFYLARKVCVKKAQPLSLDWKCSLNHAVLNLQPPAAVTHPYVTFTFCVDTSESMKGDRIEKVQKALGAIFQSAQNLVEQSKGAAKFHIAVVGFNNDPSIIIPPTRLKIGEEGTRVLEHLNKQVSSFQPKGGTYILKGLQMATMQMEQMANQSKATHTVVLLSDGEDQAKFDAAALEKVKGQLKVKQARLYTIGIGKGHSQEFMRKLVPTQEDGEYLDATDEKNIFSSMERSYTKAISPFSEIRIESSLPAGSWFWDRQPSMSTDGKLGSSCTKKTLNEGATRTRVEINTSSHPHLDLSRVSFDLHYLDRQRRAGRVKLNWTDAHVMRSSVLHD